MSMRYPGGLIAPTPVNQQFPSGVWTGPQSAPYQANNVWANDSSFKNTTLLLHGDGATTPFIKDASTNNFQITLNGDTKPNNLTPFITNGYWSTYFGTSNYLTIPNDVATDPGTGDFDVEAWVYHTSSASTLEVYFAVYSGGVSFYRNASGKLEVAQDAVAALLTGATTVPINQWNHVAVTRSGTTLRLFLNGVQDASTTNSTNLVGGVGYIGGAFGPTFYLQGYMSNLRMVKGSAVYTSAFTPSTTPLTAISGTSLLTCQSNRFVDNSSNAFSLTVNGSPSVSMQQPFTAPSGTSLYGSGYFDGTGDSLTSSNNSAFNLGSNNFTVEAWVYVTATPGGSGAAIIGKNSATYPGGYEFNFVVDTGRTIFFGAYTTTLVSLQGAIVTSLNSWNHVAAVRSGSNWALFVNGVRDVTATASGTVQTTTSSLYVGDYGGGSRNLTGYISNVRLVNGSAIYDPTVSTLTVPTAPLTPVTNTSLLTLQTNGPATNNGFLDSSYNSFPVTRNGNTTQGSFNPYQTTGYWSNYFDGSGDYLTIPSSSTFSFTGSFTWEAWVYLPVTTSGAEIVSKHVSGVTGWYMLAITSSLNVNFTIWDGSNNSSYATTSGALTLGTWNHIAGGRNGSTVFACLNGVYTSSALTVTPRTSDAVVTIGINASGSGTSFNGYISNLRAVSAAVYTGNYTVPTAPLTAIASTQLLTCQSNRFKDNSSNAVALTSTGNTSVQIYQPFTLPALQYTPQVFGGSGYFDGSGDYFTVPTSNAFNFTGDATCECWIYPNALSTNSQLFGFNNGVSDLKWIGVLLSTSGAVSGAATAGAGGSFTSANGVVGVGRWHHIAWVKNGATVYLYVNGVQVASGASSAVYAYQASPLLIGRLDGNNSLCFNGYMADMRIVKTAVYTSAFTPPTAPLTPIANTQLLLSMTNAAIFDNSGMNDLETVGDAKVSTAVTKYGTGSMYFDGSGDYLLLQGGQNFTFGTSDFTIEMWIYVVSGLNADIVYYDGRPTSTNGLYNIIYTNSTGKLVYNTNSADRITGTTTLSTGIWYHIALSRSGTNTKLFLNGVQEGSPYTDSNSYIVGANRPVIAGNGYTLGNAPLNGYIDDLRITKGVARYVTNFTPPVARMPNQ